MDAKVYITSVLIVICICVVCPYCAFNTYQFYKFRSSIILRKRNVRISLFIDIFLIIWAFFFGSLYLSAHGFNEYMTTTQNRILLLILEFVYVYSAHGANNLILLRFWLIFYAFCWNKATLNYDWKIHINAQKSVSKHENWILKHKKTFGNAKWLLTHVFLRYYLPMATILLVLYFMALFEIISDTPIQFLDLFFFLMPYFAIFVLWKKTPTYYDRVFYRAEMKRLIVYMSIALFLLFAGIVMTLGFFKFTAFMESVYFTIVVMCNALFIIYFQTTWVLKKIRSANVTQNANFFADLNPKYDESMLSFSSFPSPTLPPAAITGTIAAKHGLSAILKNKHAFNLLMQHLMGEFSMENLLAFVEFSQFRELLQNKESAVIEQNEDETEIFYDEINNNHGDNNNNNNRDSGGTQEKTIIKALSLTTAFSFSATNYISKPSLLAGLALPADLPQSFIVFEQFKHKHKDDDHENGTAKPVRNTEESRAKRKHIQLLYLPIIQALYTKYIEIGSEFEVNIGYGKQSDIRSWILQHSSATETDDKTGIQFQNNNNNGNDNRNRNSNHEILEIYELFEECRLELYRLMSHSLTRFRNSKEYETIVAELNETVQP